MTEFDHPGGRDLVALTDAAAAVDRITQIYDGSVAAIRGAFVARLAGNGAPDVVDATYPYLGVAIARSDLHVDARLSYGVLLEPGIYGTTLTRPDLFGDYYREQIELLLRHHRVAGRGRRQPSPHPAALRRRRERDRRQRDRPARLAGRASRLPDLSATDDAIANGTFRPAGGEARAARPLHRRAGRLLPRPAAPLHRHLGRAFPEASCCSPTTSATSTSSSPSGASRDGAGTADYVAFVEPGDVTPNPRRANARPDAAARACRRCRPII